MRKKRPNPKPVGRPPIPVTEEVLTRAYELAKSGLTKKQICSGLGWTYQTFMDKQLEYPELSDRIDKGSGEALGMVENMHFLNAITKQVDKFGNVIHGDKGAQQFILKTRGGYKETTALEVSGTDGEAVKVEFYFPKQGRGPEGN